MKAWQEPQGVIRDVAHADPETIYAPEVAAFYTTNVPDGTVNGATLVNGQWVNPEPTAPPEPEQQYNLQPGPNAFKLLFTFPEGIAIYKSQDDGVKYFMRMVDDPRTDVIDLSDPGVQQAVGYLSTLDPPLIQPSRVPEILKGVPL